MRLAVYVTKSGRGKTATAPREKGARSGRPSMGRHESERANGVASARELETGPKFRSVRRVFKIIDRVGGRREDLTAKQLVRKVETSLSNCYYLLHILVEKGYVEKVPKSGVYRLGPTIGALKQNAKSDLDATIQPVVSELAQRASRNVYTAVLSDGEVTVTEVVAPPDGPRVGVAPGFQGATHALALGKVLLASEGSAYVDDYVEDYVEDYVKDHGLEAFTPRTITQPALLHAKLNKARMVGLTTDFEELALNLCCVAAPVQNVNGRVEEAIGLSTTPRRIREEGQRHLIGLVQRVDASEPSKLVRDKPEAVTVSFLLEHYGYLGIEVKRNPEDPTISMSWGGGALRPGVAGGGAKADRPRKRQAGKRKRRQVTGTSITL